MSALIQKVTDISGLKPGVTSGLILIAVTLSVGSLVRFAALAWTDPAKRRQRLGSLVVWWIGLLILALVAYGGKWVGVIVFAILSGVGLREYFRLLDRFVIDTTGRVIAFVAIPFTYAGVWLDNDLWVVMSVPVIGFLLFATGLINSDKTTGYLMAVASLTWGTGLLVFLLSHAARLLTLPPQTNSIGGPAGWLVYLIVLTEGDDIFQALWGRLLGKRKITPRVSPNKTLEGLIGGVLSTVLMGILLAPWLTPLADPWIVRWEGVELRLPYFGAVAASLLISLAGFLGDLNMSALKRDAGVKDTGDFLPGQGGLLDRMDSLTFTAPAFYYFVRVVYW